MALAAIRFKSVGSFAVYSLLIVVPIVCGSCVLSLFCNVILSVLSSSAIILLRKTELFALL